MITPKFIKIEIPIPNDIKKIKKLFNNYGYTLYLVGGSIRDFIMGKNCLLFCYIGIYIVIDCLILASLLIFLLSFSSQQYSCCLSNNH